MKFSVLATIVFGLITSCSRLQSQDFPPTPEPAKEHQWLQQFVGHWDCQSKATLGPGQQPMICKGTMTTRKMGEFWILNEIQNDVLGTTVQGLQTIGYDTAKKKYVGTWVDSMTNFMWHYEGSVDEAGKKITLQAEGPNLMVEGKLAQYRDAYEFKSADHIVATSSMLNDKGEWITFMSGNFHRKK